MAEDDKDPKQLSKDQLDGVQGGRRTYPSTVTGKFSGNDTIVGVSNDTLFAGRGDDIKGFNIGMPPYVKKK